MKLRRIGQGSYETQDGSYVIEKQDEAQTFPGYGWSNVTWLVMDSETNETLAEYPTLDAVRKALAKASEKRDER